MIKKTVLFVVLALVLTGGNVLFAADVAVVSHGKKYHDLTCSLLAGKKTYVMDEKQAIAKGLKPCDKCLGLKVTIPLESNPTASPDITK